MSQEDTRDDVLDVSPPPHDEAHQPIGELKVPYVVAVGASAGGLEALERFFSVMPTDTGMAFVVVQHLSPDFKSLMGELLARWTDMKIHRVENGMDIEPNTINLMPPMKEMIISGGRLLLTDKDVKSGLTLPIDQFFRSLAQDCGQRAIAVVLSGTGSDGSRGVCDIARAGGYVCVQHEQTAKFDGMPRSAIETGVVHAVLPPEEIPQAILRYIKHPNAIEDSKQADGQGENDMDGLFRLLREAYNIDFSYYKPTTVLRRTERRLQINHVSNLSEYLDRVRHDPEELDALYRDLLIGVTGFFRDKEAFECLEKQILPDLVADVPHDRELRAWVAGCATGEEAFSLAISIR